MRSTARRNWRVGLFLIASGLLPAALSASPLMPRVEFLEDQGRGLNISDVASPALSSRFETLPEGIPTFPLSDSAFWFRFRIDALPAGASPELLEVAYSPLDYVDLYLPGAAGPDGRIRFERRAAGDLSPFDAREIFHRNFVFRLPARDSPGFAYLRVQTESSVIVPICLWRAEDFFRAAISTEQLTGAYYGIIFIMAMYNFFLFLSLRKYLYLWYVLYIGSYGLVLSIWNGLAFMYLWPDSPWVNQHANPTMVGLGGILTVVFTYAYFREGRQTRTIDIGFGLVLFLNAVILICGLLGAYALANRLSVISMFGGIPVIGWCVLHHLLTGYRPARFFALAFALLGVGGIVSGLRLVGLLQANFFTTIYGMQIFSGLQILLLSFALADRYRILEQERQNLAAVSEARSAFLANMSHEIRTPLNAILGAGELLAEGRLAAEQRRYIDMLQRAGNNLLSLVNDVLDLAKIQSGRMQFEMIAFDPRELIRDCASLLRPEAARKSIELRERCDPDLPERLQGDPMRLQRVLLNLTHNAIKFTEHGHVELRFARAGPDSYRIDVRDTGIGIAGDHLGRIFDSFTQADESITRRYGGTGLGLTIVREIVEAMSGRIAVESTPGAGTVFSVMLPLETVPDARTRKAGPDSATGGPDGESDSKAHRRLNILLAEDNPDNRMLVLAFLRDRPYKIDIAENGAEALELFRARRYDVVLMDIQMPVMDGLAAVQAIRAFEKSRPDLFFGHRTPVYALTAHALQEEVEKNLEAGCDGHISKPVRRQVLREMLDRI